jgi:hypothetical protein
LASSICSQKEKRRKIKFGVMQSQHWWDKSNGPQSMIASLTYNLVNNWYNIVLKVCGYEKACFLGSSSFIDHLYLLEFVCPLANVWWNVNNI